jgi:hypothetical protein
MAKPKPTVRPTTTSFSVTRSFDLLARLEMGNVSML